MTDSDAWGVTIKVPEEVRDEVRQIVQEQAPGGTTYGDCLLAGAKALAEEGTGGNPIPDPEDLSIPSSVTGEVGFEPLDAEEIAAEVWRRADYAELSEQVARRVREEFSE